MKKKIITILLVGLVFLISACSFKKKEFNDAIHEIFVSDTNKIEDVFLSNFVQRDIEYIPLETNSKCMLGKNVRIYSNDSLIIAFAKNQIYLFDRSTGKFLNEIGHYGKDPQGYKSTIYSFPYNESRNSFFAKGWESNTFYEYNYHGSLKRIQVPSLAGEPITELSALNDTLYIGHVWNYNGKQKRKLIIFSLDNTILKTYPQHNSFDWDINKNGLNLLNWEGWFYNYDNKINFYERFTDTVFHIRENELIPRYVFKNHIGIIDKIYESDRYLLFCFETQNEKHCCIYDKKKEETKFFDNLNGVVNDIDNFIPLRFISTNNKNEIIGYQYAYEVLDWFDKNSNRASQLREKYKRLKNIGENDNPVVMIAKLKD